MTEVLKRRFAELVAQADSLNSTHRVRTGFQGGAEENVDQEVLLAWRVKARNLLRIACGPESEHYKAFADAEEYVSWSGNYASFKRCLAVFSAAKEDFDGGYVSSLRSLIQAEVFDNELEQAKELLDSGYHQAAAIIAGVVLETNLRQLCAECGIGSGKMDRMNADLAKAGKYNSITQKRITSITAIRNAAAHGHVGEFSRADVASMIDDVARLLESWLS
ncbi:hypothetical protein [Lysobacter arvi]|uniref:DUF4145 domain-containing protein n=1 Tax=Lysobacter arvi TaxID=3038776 RepID=A0ABU1CDG8_9GAMM|nr:hypothetical protein [Lysobacter arvi]MDR0183226.1 hypothetical protein [Lysobacter arvi]